MLKMNDSTSTGKSSCPNCQSNGGDTSGDNLVSYSDGHQYCFACCSYFPPPNNFKGTTTIKEPESTSTAFLAGTISELPHRGIREETCRFYDYRVASNYEIENFLVDGIIVSQHVRNTIKKDFWWNGSTKNIPLFGQWLFPSGGKRLLITEGAIDCLTMSQMFGNKYPVVSIPNGVGSATKNIKENYDFVSSFETIVLCFDMDEPGQKAVRAVADLLPPGKVRIMKLPRKDPNEMLMAAESAQLISSYWNAVPYSPDSILHVSSILNTPKEETVVYEYPWDSMTTFMVGQDSGRLNLWTAAPGQGKTSILREIMFQHLKEGRGVGCIFLEESPAQTVDDLIGLMLRKSVRRIHSQRMLNEFRKGSGKDPIADDVIDTLTDDEYNEACDAFSKLPLYVYNHIGNTEIKNILNRLDFMASGLGCKVLVVDHITLLGNMLLDSQSDNGINNERLILDDVMKHLRALVERTGCIIHIISHIKKTDKNVDEGAKLSLSDLRGSGSLAQIADNVFSLERNRQSPDEKIQNTTLIRVLKNRKTGKCGISSALYWDKNKSSLEETKFSISQEGDVSFYHENIF